MWMNVRATYIDVEKASCATIYLARIIVNAEQAISMIHSEGCV